MATDAGIRNVDELQEFGKQISQLGDQMNAAVWQLSVKAGTMRPTSALK